MHKLKMSKLPIPAKCHTNNDMQNAELTGMNLIFNVSHIILFCIMNF